jgi:serine/threonine protein kinase/tetratricopeptide (TPR) repeat protein
MRPDIDGQRFLELLEAALDVEPGKRRRFLEASDSDPALIAEVLEALEDEEDLGDFLDNPAADAIRDGEREETIGPYQILDVLGEGGMGVVYLAEQRQPIQRRVALKVIRSLRTTRQELRQRFEVERRTLARLDHPSIAKVFDAGDTPAGEPYFAMELVEGRNIVADADARQLGLEARMRLVAEVARAIHHAHLKGILHRDLKPSNVLISEIDGRLVPRVIDFGIAKPLDAEDATTAGLTVDGSVVGTPAYLAPEALFTTDGDADVRSDVYTLGVMLFELLAGERPLGKSTRSLAELLHELHQAEVGAPSARLAALPAEDLAARAAARGTTSRALIRGVRGELDWITLRATARDRERRYGSAAELADDLERYLARQPVLAGPPSTLYRARRFAARHRISLGAVALVMTSLVVSLLLVGREAGRARRAEAETRRVVDFLVGLFEVADPGQSRGETITARELLDRGSQSVGAELDADPQVGARLLHTVGRVERKLGLLKRARTSAAEALAIRRRELGPDAAGVAESLYLLGDAELALGDHDAAEADLEEALAIRERRGEGRSPEAAEILDLLGHLRGVQGRYPEAIALHRRALEILESQVGEEDPRTAATLDHLAISRFDFDQDDPAALAAFRRGREIRERLLGPDHPDTVSSLQGEAMALTMLGRQDEARTVYEDVLARRERLLGPDHPDVAQVLTNLTNVLGPEDDGRARRLLERAAAIWEQAVGADAPRRGIVLQNLGSLELGLGELAAARRHSSEALRIFETSYGPDHPYCSAALGTLGDVARDQGDLEAAAGYYRRALTIYEQVVRPDDDRLLGVAERLLDVLERQGADERARALRERHPSLETAETD